MRRPAGWIRPALIALVNISLALACRTKPQAVTLPAGPPVPEALIREYVSQGDELFQAMHLHAWRQAEAAYAKAYGLAQRPEIRDKLALVKLLRMTREVDEDIACPSMEEDIRFICQDPSDARAQAFCDLAKAYALGPAAAADQMKRVEPSVLQVEASPLDAYFFALHARTFGLDAKNDDFKKQLSAKYKDSPLFMYLDLGMGSSSVTDKFPDFAEAWEFSAEMSFQRNQIKAARTGFSKALDLIPDYTRAINGLANVYFFTLEDYANALKTYERALKWDPQNTGALFGKGAALHSMDKYDESNAALDLMLATDLSRRGRVALNSVQYYRGEANYYKSYNYHLMKDPARARELIDVAKRDLPNSQEINYLSGLLYFNAGQLDAAKADFEKAAKQGKNCYAYHYLGLIELKTGGPTAASQFLTCSACLERAVRTFQQNVQSAEKLDIEPSEKKALRLRMEMKLVQSRDSSAELIQHMIGLIREASIDDKWKEMFTTSMNDLLAKITAIGAR